MKKPNFYFVQTDEEEKIKISKLHPARPKVLIFIECEKHMMQLYHVPIIPRSCTLSVTL